ncbi:MAG: neutral/alkaline non-lysosomal ceramidase N-terminal domain-containing protein [Planctomycetia bacterium]|nr:neutral/alkaline non-lysosomal ceramidase N-terminal domain-containing protein [Planctomycetia bacterium]
MNNCREKKRRYTFFISSAVYGAVLFCSVFCSVGLRANEAAGHSPLTVGAASVSIMPKEPVTLGGYGLRTEKSQGARSDIYARALYIKTEKTQFIWIVCDLIGFDRGEIAKIKKRVAANQGLHEENIIVSATHTHTAPATMNIGCPEKATRYIDGTLLPCIEKIAEQAVATASPCRMVTAQGNCSLMHDRRNDPVPGDGAAPNPDKKLAYVDTRVPVVGFKRSDGSFIAILVQFTAHPTSWSDLLIGSEWPGATAIAVKKTFGETVEPFIIQGAAGNVGSPKRNAPQEEIQTWGDTIVASFANELLQAEYDNENVDFVATTIPVAAPTVTADEVRQRADALREQWAECPCVATTVVTRFETELLRRIDAGTIDHFDSPTCLITLGDHVFVTVPYEVFSQMNREVAKYTSKNVHIVGYTNGVIMYLPSADAFEQGGYEPDAGLWFANLGTAPGSLEDYAKAVGLLLNKNNNEK